MLLVRRERRKDYNYCIMYGSCILCHCLSEAKKYILNELTKGSLHDASLEEYRLAHEEKEICHLKEKGDFPQLPIVLITHGSQFETKAVVKGITHYSSYRKQHNLQFPLMSLHSFPGTSYILAPSLGNRLLGKCEILMRS